MPSENISARPVWQIDQKITTQFELDSMAVWNGKTGEASRPEDAPGCDIDPEPGGVLRAIASVVEEWADADMTFVLFRSYMQDTLVIDVNGKQAVWRQSDKYDVMTYVVGGRLATLDDFDAPDVSAYSIRRRRPKLLSGEARYVVTEQAPGYFIELTPRVRFIDLETMKVTDPNAIPPDNPKPADAEV